MGDLSYIVMNSTSSSMRVEELPVLYLRGLCYE